MKQRRFTAEDLRMRTQDMRWVNVDDLEAHPQNWRTHPPNQRAAMEGTLGRLGFAGVLEAFEIDGHLRLVDGHLRQEVLPGATVPVVVMDFTEAEAREYLLTKDALAGLAGAASDRLEALLADRPPGGDAVDDMLADIAAKNGVAWPPAPAPGEDHGAQVDRAEELREKWGTERGQLWEIGAHRLLCGDSTDAGDVARVMGGERAALMATDPPYLVNYQGGNHPQSKVNKAEVKDKHWDDYVDPETSVGFFAGFIRAALDEALTSNPAIYQWHADLRRELVVAAWRQSGLLLHQIIVWQKARGVLTHSHFMWSHEPCAYGWIEGKGMDSKPPANERTVWEIDQQGDSDNIHPTQKPRELFARPMRWHIPAGGLAYEPFSGSGTALVAAEQEGRRCYAIEIAPAFVAVALERMAGMGLEPRLA